MTERTNHQAGWQALTTTISGAAFAFNEPTLQLLETGLVERFGPTGKGYGQPAIDRLLELSKEKP